MATAGGKRKRVEEQPSSSASAATAGRSSSGINSAHLAQSGAYAAAFRAGAPFPHLQVRDILSQELMLAARKELLSEKQVYFRKKNDLYDFQQTDSLRLQGQEAGGSSGAGGSTGGSSATGHGALARLRSVLYGSEFRAWMGAVTGIKTTDKVDISAAQYVRGSHLLCHDDDLSTRRIAFILYLVPEGWDASDGGTLDLYDCAPQPLPAMGGGTTPVPGRVVSRIVPAWNSIAFFEVNPVSFHAVAEVLDDSKGPRLSVSGWFHGTTVPRPGAPIPPEPALVVPRGPALAAAGPSTTATSTSSSAAGAAASSSSAALLWSRASPIADPACDPLEAWINPAYLSAKTRKAMAAQFAKDASLQLQSFLLPERFAAVMRALGSQPWRRVGPPILANYGTAATTDGQRGPPAAALDPAQQLFEFLTGATFAAFLHGIYSPGGSSTSGGASYTPSLVKLSGALRCFTHGDYTLLADPTYKAEAKDKKAKDKGLVGVAAASAASSAAAAGGGSGVRAGAGAGAAADDSSSSAPARGVDAVLCLVAGSEDDWGESAGGYMTYLTSDEELLTVPPSSNSLSLVAMEPGVMSFVKYLTQDAPENRYDVVVKARFDE